MNININHKSACVLQSFVFVESKSMKSKLQQDIDKKCEKKGWGFKKNSGWDEFITGLRCDSLKMRCDAMLLE